MSSIRNFSHSTFRFPGKIPLKESGHDYAETNPTAFGSSDTLLLKEATLHDAKRTQMLARMKPPKLSPLERVGAFFRGTHDRVDYPGAKKLLNFDSVDGRVYRGAMPGSAKQIEKLRNTYNVRTIIDLRRDEVTPKAYLDFEREWARQHGIRYVRISMNSHHPPTKEQMAKLFQAIEDTKKQSGNVYVHCKLGIDRTGAMMAAYETKLGRPQPAVYANLKKYGYNILHRLSRPAQRNFVRGPELAQKVAEAEALRQKSEHSH